MKEIKRTTVTAALPYANGPLHIGHIAGAYLPSDIYVRNLRQRGKEVLFVCGSDEHGAAITIRAMKEGTTPRAIVDKYHAMMGKAFQDFGIHFDIYHRTSCGPARADQPGVLPEVARERRVHRSRRSSSTMMRRRNSSSPTATSWAPVPTCGNPDAYGDQCEKCGSALSPKDLIDPRSTLSGAKPVLKPTKHWYLPMERSQQWVEEWINTGMLDGVQHHDPKEWKSRTCWASATAG